jgi:hypothetical protein
LAQAATYTWANTAGGNWSVAANWSPNGVPSSSDTAKITAVGTYTVTLDENANVNNLTIGGAGSGAQTLQGNSFNVTATSALINSGGILIMTNGTTLFGTYVVDSGAVLTVSGATLAAQVTVKSGGQLLALGPNYTSIGLNGNANNPNYWLSVQSGGVVNAGAPGFFVYAIVTNAGVINLTNNNTYLNNNGTPNSDGGVYNLGGVIDLWNNANIFGQSGNEYLVNQGTINLSSGTGTSAIGINNLTNSGTLSAQHGTLQLDGIYVILQSTGTLSVGLNSATDFGSITYDNSAALNLAQAGTFQVTLNGGYMPALGSSFTVLLANSSGTFSGAFASFSSPSGAIWQTNYSATSVVLTNIGQIVWATPANITYDTALGASQLNASTTPALAGSFTYNPPLTTILNAGNNQPLSATFKPSVAGQAPASATVTINVEPLPVTLTGTRPYDGTAIAASTILSVANRVGSDVVNVASGSATLAGAAVGSEAIISGTLALGGAQAANYTLVGASGSVSITVAPLTIGSLSLPNAAANTGYNQTLMASGGGGQSYTWSITSGSLPPGLGLSSGGVLSGSPSTAGTYTFTVQVTSGSQTATATFNLIVSTPTTIDAVNRYAYGANIGWMDWRGDTNNGAIIGAYVCSGYIYSANVGWINLGSGSPANGIQYQNNSAGDFGVNQDGLGHLSGYAYGANIGWINFTTIGAPTINMMTGTMSGEVWSANCGWISLSNAVAYVQTDTISPGALDPDGSGLPIAWELTYFGTTGINPNEDPTGKGMTVGQDYVAGTNPNNANSVLQITAADFSSSGTSAMLSWDSVSTRFYYIEETLSLSPANWTTNGVGLISAAGTTTTSSITDLGESTRFYRIQAVRPLTP